jgi:hypothetical protein
MTTLLSTLFCLFLWVMPVTETQILPQAGCYSCCDDGDWVIESGECVFLPGVPDAEACLALNHQ